MRIGIYTFYSGDDDRKFNNYDDAIKYVMDSEKPIKYTYGFAYRHPTTHNKPITKAEAYDIMKSSTMTDIDEFDGYIHINQYSSHDMY